MEKKIITDELLGEEYIEATHKSGLKVFIWKKDCFKSSYAIFGTKYGSIDTRFRIKGEEDFSVIPEGIAHFLEHKLFESEEGDVFRKFAMTGAQANAYTSFDRTCYLFGCSDKFNESFKILLDFVQSPYFTEQSVAKEQGIIGQEIRMYDDDAPWRVMFNLLCALYKNHPVRIDIAGTVESIAKITPDLLYRCYNTFYNPNNMFICVAGNVDPDCVLEMIDSGIRDCEKVTVEKEPCFEPDEIAKTRIEQKLAVSQPMFCMGFKEKCEQPDPDLDEKTEVRVLLEIIAGRSSKLFGRLLEEGLINENFGTEHFYGNGYKCELFEGESTDPEKVYSEILKEIESLRKNGIDKEDFERVKNALYGAAVMRYNSIEGVASALTGCAMSGLELFDSVNALRSLTLEAVQKRLDLVMDESKCAMSVINPL